MKTLTAAERLIVAADFSPKKCEGEEGVRQRLSAFAESLRGTGIILKVNSSLRAFGNDLLRKIREFGLRLFADLKLNDISATLALDGEFLAYVNPELLTVMCSSGVEGMKALKDALPKTEVLGVTVLTNLKPEEVMAIYGCTIETAVGRFATLAKDAGIGGLVGAPQEIPILRQHGGDAMTINTPAIRPSWAIVAGDDQNRDRIATPASAIRAGATRIVVGRPIMQAPDPLEAVKRTIAEIEEALATVS